MAILSVGSLLALRHDRRLLLLPPYLSLACILIGVAWLLVLPLDEYSRRTYISENALLPGQVHTYFSGTEYDIFAAYKHEITQTIWKPSDDQCAKMEEIWHTSGLKTARQKYNYTAGGKEYSGQNVYAVLRAPRGDATEAVVLVASLKNMEGHYNIPGVTLAMALSRYFRRWSLWSKDIIFLVTPDSRAGPQAWVDAYHDQHNPALVDSLPLKSGALQGAIVVDFPQHHRFSTMHISYEGLNGQLANLDLFNTAVNVAEGQHGMHVALQNVFGHNGSWRMKLQTMLKGMLRQGLGHASGPHSVFVPYHVDAITLTSIGEGREDEAAFGRVVESMFRSLNNLMEHFHQSFFFYLLMDTRRFVSIGTYLPSAMLIAASFTITAISLWVASGRPAKDPVLNEKQKQKGEVEVVEHKGMKAAIPQQELQVVERNLFLPGTVILASHLLGLVPLYLFNNATYSTFEPLLAVFAVTNAILPKILAIGLERYTKVTTQQKILLKGSSLLFLGIFLATLATVNFALALMIGLLACPLSFVGASSVPEEKQIKDRTLLEAVSLLSHLTLQLLSPPVVFGLVCWYVQIRPADLLLEAAFGWHVWGVWTQVVVWCMWWPAWLVSSTGLHLVA